MSSSLKGSKIGKQKSSGTKNSQQVTTITIQRGGKGLPRKYCFYEKGNEVDDRFYWAIGECEHKTATETNRNVEITEDEFMTKQRRPKNLPPPPNNNLPNNYKLPPGGKVWLTAIYDPTRDQNSRVSAIRTIAIDKVERTLQKNNTNNIELLDGLLKSKDKEKYDDVKKRYRLRQQDDLAFVIDVKDFKKIYGNDYNSKIINKNKLCKDFPARHECTKTLTGNNRPLTPGLGIRGDGYGYSFQNNITTNKFPSEITGITDLNAYFGDNFTQKDYTSQVMEMALRQKKIIENERNRTGLYTNSNGKTCKLDEIVNSWKYCIIDSMVSENSVIMIFKRNSDTGNLDAIKMYVDFKNYSLNNMNNERKKDTGVCVWLENNPTVYII